jgi:hypothetical protein
MINKEISMEAEPNYAEDALKVLENYQETTKAFESIHAIFSRLDLPDNREVLAESMSSSLNNGIIADDLIDAKLAEINPKDDYGVTTFPVTLSIPVKNWTTLYFPAKDGSNIPCSDFYNIDQLKDISPQLHDLTFRVTVSRGKGLAKKLLPDPDTRMNHISGMFIYQHQFKSDSPLPLNKTGLMLTCEAPEHVSNIVSEENATAHESLHQAYEIFSPFRSSFYENTDFLKEPEKLSQLADSQIINEINAYRANVLGGELNWLGHNSVFINVFESVGWYFKKLEDQGIENPIFDKKAQIEEACQTMAHLQHLGLTQSVITHILLNCKNLEQLISWKKINPEQIQEEFKSEKI